MTLRYQLYIFQIVLSLVLFTFIGFTYYSYDGEHKKSINKQIQNEISFHKKNIISSIKNANNNLVKYKERFKLAHLKTLKTLKEDPSLDLYKLKEDIKTNYLPSHIDIDVFLINKDYIIFDSTFKEDIGLNLSLVTDGKKTLDKSAIDGKIYLSDCPSTDAVDLKHKYYSVSKLNESIFLQLGFIDDTLGNQIESIINYKDDSPIKISLYDITIENGYYRYYLMKKREKIKKEDILNRQKKVLLNEVTDDYVVNTLKSKSQIHLVEGNTHTVYVNIFDSDMFKTIGMSNIVMKIDFDITEQNEFIEKYKTTFVFSLVIVSIILIFFLVFVKSKFTNPTEEILNSLLNQKKVENKTILSSNNELSNISIEYNKLYDELKKEIELNKKLLLIDPLTKAYNRKAYDTTIKDNLSFYYRYNAPFSIILFDIDDFKRINDSYGHIMGDKVLKDIVNLISKQIRATDSLYRMGGEEFLIICKNTIQSDALTLAENLRNSIKMDLSTVENEIITVSIGVTEVTNNDTEDSIYKRADDNLYLSKNSGKNRVTTD